MDAFLAARGGRVNWLASMAQDVYKGRRSEIDFMNGLIAAKGREVGVPTPFNDAVIEAMRAVDSRTLPQEPEHVDRVMRAAGR